MHKLAPAAALLVAPLAVLAALRLAETAEVRGPLAPRIHRDGGFVGSSACATCHPEHHASWSRTFHRTMTQLPGPDTVLGRFDGRAVAYEGRSARPLVDDGRYVIEVPVEGSRARRAEVALAVGSRRYQQYFERVGSGVESALVRLPILWHVGA